MMLNQKKPEDYVISTGKHFTVRDFAKLAFELVDLDYIPDNIENEVIRQLENYKMNDRSKLFNYFVKNKLKGLMDVIQEF